MKTLIIGGGAAGMMCAATIAEENPQIEVVLIEKNPELGKKVLISGGGRCNVTTGLDDLQLVMKNYPRGAKFLQSAMHRFGPSDVQNWFKEHGVELKCEKDRRVFPVSDNGEDVVKAFRNVFVTHNVMVLSKHSVCGLELHDGQYTVLFKNREPIVADKVVLALGGQAYRQTGSVGDGYALAEKLGHHITPLAASLNSFITEEKWPKSLSGVSFEKITITARKKIITGPLLFTHTGVSGPAVFALSSALAFEEYNRAKPLELFIDFCPEISVDQIQTEAKKLLLESPKKYTKNTFHFVPLSVMERILTESNVPADRKNAELSKRELNDILHNIKHLTLHVIGRGAGEEFVTAGGVELSEVNPKTMESRLHNGLYFAGEILDIDGFTGGFNLQAAWATGRAAGLALAS